MNIGENIRFYRKQKGFSRAELAEKLGKTRQSILKYEKEEIIPSIEVLQAISNELSVSIINLIEGAKDNNNVINEIKEAIRNIEKAILREGYNPNLDYMKGNLDGLKIALKILNNKSED